MTGKPSSAGNHSNDTLVLKKYDRPFLNIFKESDDSVMLNYLRLIENKEPESYSFSNVLTLLKKYINEPPTSAEELIKNEKLIAERYELYKKSIKKRQEYHKYIVRIQEEYLNKTLTKQLLSKINVL